MYIIQKNVLDYHTSVPVFVFIFLPALFVVAGVATIVCGIIGFVALNYGSFSEARCILGTVSTMNAVYSYTIHVYALHGLLVCMMCNVMWFCFP